MPIVHQLEIDLGLPDDIKDQDLVEVEKKLSKSVEDAKKSVRSQAVNEAQEKEDEKPKEEPEFIVPNEWKW